MPSPKLACSIVALLAAPSLFAQAPASGQNLSPAALATRAKVQNVPEIPYESVPNFLKLPPNLFLGEGIGIASNSKGHVFVYTRSQRTRLFEFDQNGTFVREIGEGLYGFVFAHAVRVDPQDNIWAVVQKAIRSGYSKELRREESWLAARWREPIQYRAKFRRPSWRWRRACSPLEYSWRSGPLAAVQAGKLNCLLKTARSFAALASS